MDINRKYFYFAGGHLTNLPPFITYTSIVIRDSIRISRRLQPLFLEPLYKTKGLNFRKRWKSF